MSNLRTNSDEWQAATTGMTSDQLASAAFYVVGWLSQVVSPDDFQSALDAMQRSGVTR